MNPTERQIAIAEENGYQHVAAIYRMTGMLVGYKPAKDPSIVKIPDYLNDLNAMYEVEESIDQSLRDTYEFWLGEITKTSALSTSGNCQTNIRYKVGGLIANILIHTSPKQS